MTLLASLAILALGAPDREVRLRSAMLRIYVHGVDDRLAEQVVEKQDLPVLRRLLADPSFPRRDNVVAFLAHRDGGDAVPGLLALLQDPPGALDVPEEERAVLLVPHALGHLARRGSEEALDALLGFSAAGNASSLLAAAASRAPAPDRFLSDLTEAAVRGLGLAGGPAARARLTAIERGEVRLTGSRDRLAIAAREALAPGLPAESAATRAPPQDGGGIGGLDLQELSHDAGLTWANHPALADPMTEVELRAVLRNGSVRAGRRDYPDDVACCVSVSPSGTAQTLGQVGDGLDVLDSESETTAVLTDPVARVKVVRQINYCGGFTTNAAGCGIIGGNGIALVRFSESEGGLWLHEWGHNVGLVHVDDPRAVMYGAIFSADLLTQSECDVFHTPRATTQLVPAVTDVCADADNDGIAGSADACATVFDPEQIDSDGDGLGDACDSCPGAPRPTSPVLLAPVDGADFAPGAPSLQWGAVADAVSYDVLLTTPANRFAAAATSSGTTWTVAPPLSAGSTFRWQTRATTACGVGRWSHEATFTTCPQSPPALQVPLDQVTTPAVGLLLGWSGVFGATEYTVQIARDAGFADLARESTSTVRLVSVQLSPGTTYHWRVRARGVCGSSPWSAPRVFTTCRTQGAVPSTPPDGALLSTRTPVLHWQGVAGATGYGVEVALDAGFTQILRGASTWESLLRLEPPLRGGPATYYWRVAAQGPCGNAAGPAFRFRVCPSRPDGRDLWLDLPPLPQGGRAEPAVVYDPIRHRTLVFGGCAGPGCDGAPAPIAGDLWAYDHRTARWTQVTAAGIPPSPRMGAHAVYDPVRDRMLLFGGRRWASDAQPLLDAFALTLSGTPTWSRLAGSGDAPAFPDGFTWAVSDPRRDRLLVGTYGSPRLHALDLGTSVWTSLATAAPPQPQHPIVRGGSIVLDTANDRLVCFGGLWEDGETRSFTNAVSELRLGAPFPEWREVSTAGPLPAARAHHAAAYDAAGQRLLVYGGWWGTAYGDISQHADAQQLTLPASGTPVWSALPSAEAGGRMAQGAVAALGEMVVFGGAGTAGEAARADNLSLAYGTSRAFWRPCATRTPRTAR